jgi:hypothetical protein
MLFDVKIYGWCREIRKNLSIEEKWREYTNHDNYIILINLQKQIKENVENLIKYQEL